MELKEAIKRIERKLGIRRNFDIKGVSISGYICPIHPIMMDERCSICWEAKERTNHAIQDPDK